MLRATTKSLKLSKLNFAIPLMATAGIAALGISFINYNPEDFASATNSTTLTGTISYDDEYITISNNSTVNLGTEAVTSSASYIYASDNVTVSTNVATGYDLYISSGDKESAALTTSSSYTTIPTTSGTGGDSGTPAALDDNSYGYAVPSGQIGNTAFDSSYTSPTSSSKFAAVPAGTSDRIRTTSSAVTSGETTNVYYGASVSNALAPGTYTGQVIYSAVVTPTSGTTTMSVSPSSGVVDTELTIISDPTTISTAAELNTSEVQVEFRQSNVTKGTCTVTSVDVSSGYVETTCTVPGGLATGAYDVAIVIPRFGFKDTLSNGYTSNSSAQYSMQGMTTSNCQSLTTFDATSSTTITNTTYTAVDTRDLNTYSIRKLADGHCWMVQNLRLLNKSLDSSTSDTSGSFTVPASTSTYSQNSTAAGTWCATNSAGCDNKPLAYYNNDTTYGVYYNWYTATAGSGSYNTSSGSVDYSICPKGWKLPYSATDDYSWYYLYNTGYSTNATNFRTATNTGSGYWSGNFNDGSLRGVGSYGYWWSRTAYNANYAFLLRTYSSDVDYQNGNYNKHYGNSVRCVFVGS